MRGLRAARARQAMIPTLVIATARAPRPPGLPRDDPWLGHDTRGYEHAFAPPAYARADHPLSQTRMTDGNPTRSVRHPALITQTG
jgi:hypothetical protein